MVSRRLVIFGGVAAAGGLAIGYALTPFSTVERAKGLVAKDGAHSIGTWIRIGTDNIVTVFVPHSEMGQGVHTSLPMMAAEELEADWSLVRMEQAPADMAFANGAAALEFLRGDRSIPSFALPPAVFGARKIAEFLNTQNTGGSASVRLTGIRGMRVAGAAAREVLIKAAAAAWGVPEREVVAKQSKLTHASGKSATYGDMAAAAATYEPSLEPKLKAKSDYTISGKPMQRFDIPAKVDGSAKYGIDVRLPNMSFAVIAATPVPGGTLKSVDSAPALAMRGVKRVVKLPAAVAVIADNTWRAKEALLALQPVWDDGPNGNLTQASILSGIEAALDKGEVEEFRAGGEVDEALKRAKRVIEASYKVPYLAHATMEVMNCTAHFEGDRLSVWSGAQDALAARATAAKAANLPIENVTFHNVAMGGGFGRRLPAYMEYIEKAVAVARQFDGPVQLVYAREEDMTHGFYRHASIARMKAALNDEGKVTAWLHTFNELYDPPEASLVNYDFPHWASRYVSGANPVPRGAWRSVDHSQHGFFIETFMDELAVAAGKDPFEFRRAHLTRAPRHKAVLELAASMAGWGAPDPKGRARGISMREAFGTIVCHVVEVSLREDNSVRVNKVWTAVDPGEVINPSTFTAQIQGGAIFGLSAALYEEITIDKGRVVQQNFSDYEIVRMEDAPEHEVRFIESGARMGGAGEPGVAPIAAAVGNAIYALTKKRVRELPFSKTRLVI